MAVMSKNYAEKVEKKQIVASTAPVVFDDGQEIASYAKGAVAEMQKGGVITGTVKKDAAGIGQTVFMPKSSATRAEAAAMIAKLLQSK